MASIVAPFYRRTGIEVFRAVTRLVAAHPVLALVILNLLATFMVYVPLYEQRENGIYLAFNGLALDNIYAYWDGPLYMIVAKAWYNVGGAELSVFETLPPEYYAAHFPGYPATIRLFSFAFGFEVGMLAATIAATSLLIWVLYELLKNLGLGKHALWLGVVFLFLPPRWLIYHSVGASEPLFILAMLSFILFYRRGQFWLAGLAGALAVVTRSPGIVLLGVYLLLTAWWYYRSSPHPTLWIVCKRRLLPMVPFALTPLLLFGVYQQQYGDFFAYFHSGDNIHLTGAPFTSIWPSILGFNWSEGNLWVYMLNAVGIFLLIRHKFYDLALFAAFLYVPLIFVAHHDLARYMLPIFPLSLLIAYHRLIGAREFKLGMLIIIPAIYIYSWSGVQANQAPAEDMQRLFGLLGG